MKEDSVSGLFSICISSFGYKHNPEVRVEQSEPNHDQKQYVGYSPLLLTVGGPKYSFPVAEHSAIQELQRFSGQKDEDIRQHGQRTHRPDYANYNICSFDRTYGVVAERNADCDIALCCHKS